MHPLIKPVTPEGLTLSNLRAMGGGDLPNLRPGKGGQHLADLILVTHLLGLESFPSLTVSLPLKQPGPAAKHVFHRYIPYLYLVRSSYVRSILSTHKSHVTPLADIMSPSFPEASFFRKQKSAVFL